MSQTVPFFITIPHAGEKVPTETPWLASLPEEILMADVDRYVDVLYKPALTKLEIPYQLTEWHRYAVDLNRVPSDVDEQAVQGTPKKAGTHTDGYHWVMTKGGIQLMPTPMSAKTHRDLTQLIYEPFHQSVRNYYELFQQKGFKNIYHIDAHSMPSIGTKMHRDPGQLRADIVVSDCSQKSCDATFRDLVIAAYTISGFKVAYNWPYLGGRVTEQYGRPELGHHAIQVELNRALYMNEKTKKIIPEHEQVQNKIFQAVSYIKSELPKLKPSQS
ncbi:MAG: N-formylglutamate amidohydrolase [Bdellovibrionaceae bacterium]|nr:N-formylglutamate amidohydrolase [Bdellovibrio sp.]